MNYSKPALCILCKKKIPIFRSKKRKYCCLLLQEFLMGQKTIDCLKYIKNEFN